MPPKRWGQNPADLEEDEDGAVWLTFQNSERKTEAEVRKVFEPFGEITDCDGALNGVDDGWVMLSVLSQEIANRCIDGLKKTGNPIGESIRMLDSDNTAGNGVPPKDRSENICLRCGMDNHTESQCKSKDRSCKKCQLTDPSWAAGHFDSVHDITESEVRARVVRLLGAKPFPDWPEARAAPEPRDSVVKIVTKRTAEVAEADRFGNPGTFGGSNQLLSAQEFGETGGIKNFTQTNAKILELVSHNNLLLMERLKDTVDDCNRQLKEKDDQIRRLQNLLNNHEENTRKLTNRLNANQEFESKVKKFFGENEDYHKKKVTELTKLNQDLVQRLEESEKARMEKVLEESDSSKVRGEVEKLGHNTDTILSKMEQVFAVVQGLDIGGIVKGDGKGDGKVDPMAGSTAALLHNKVDKAIRILAETGENQRKMNKVLQDLIKFGGLIKQEQEEGEEKKSKKSKKDKERDRSRGRKRSRSRSLEKRRRSRSDSGDRPAIQQVLPPAAIDHEFEEMKWALNMTLIGDGHWKSFTSVEDIKHIVQKMERKVNFKVMCENETLASLYDEERDSLLVNLPKSCYKVGISVGTFDLGDPGLITLKEAPMDEVRRRNEHKLQQKARIFRDLVLNLIRQNKQVIVMIPPHGEERVEVHAHWEEVLVSKLRDIRFPSIRILNMAQTMRGSMNEFKNNNDYLDMWLSPYPRPRRYLTAYGTRRMFYALRQTVTAKTPQQAGMANWPTPQSHPPPAEPAYHAPHHTSGPPSKALANASAIAPPRVEDFNCPRCTRPGHSPDVCKSKDKICRLCNNVGHFVEVHEVTDERFRQVITRVLGIDLWDSSRPAGFDGNDHDKFEPDLKRGRLEPGKRIPLEKLAEMEQRGGAAQRGGNWGRKDYY